VAIDKTTRQVAWKHKLTNALINGITPAGKNRILMTSLDGKVASIKYQ
jgi:hypothetical protein